MRSSSSPRRSSVLSSAWPLGATPGCALTAGITPNVVRAHSAKRKAVRRISWCLLVAAWYRGGSKTRWPHQADFLYDASMTTIGRNWGPEFRAVTKRAFALDGGDHQSPRHGQTPLCLPDRGADQLRTVTPRRFCAQAASFEPSTAGRSLP